MGLRQRFYRAGLWLWTWVAALVFSVFGVRLGPADRPDAMLPPAHTIIDLALRAGPIVELPQPPPLFAFGLDQGKFGVRDRRVAAVLRGGR